VSSPLSVTRTTTGFRESHSLVDLGEFPVASRETFLMCARGAGDPFQFVIAVLRQKPFDRCLVLSEGIRVGLWIGGEIRLNGPSKDLWETTLLN
jgi:hypothetical protein